MCEDQNQTPFPDEGERHRFGQAENVVRLAARLPAQALLDRLATGGDIARPTGAREKWRNRPDRGGASGGSSLGW